MSQPPPIPQPFAHDDQSERWLKYGTNTVAVSAIVVFLAILAVYLAQRKDKPGGTRPRPRSHTLKPQTVKVLADNQQPITITSFYSKAKRTDAAYGTNAAAADAESAATLDRQADVRSPTCSTSTPPAATATSPSRRSTPS